MGLNIYQFRERISKVNPDQVIGETMSGTMEQLVELNQDQLYDGKNKFGEDLSPGYLQDPYFKTIEAAQRYSDWKDEITPNPKRKKGVPNLFIVGAYHDSIKALLSGEKIIFESMFYAAADIEGKYTGIYGLGGDYKQNFITAILRPKFKKAVELATGLKMK